jgi:putative sigma-54 modulation protein
MYSAIDMVLDKIEKQIKKNKQKVRKHRGGSKSKAKDIIAEDTLHLDEEGTVRIRVRGIEYKPMDVEEAIMQMDLVKNNFLVFTNARTDQVNVLYRRKDGDYGLIQPRI